MVTIAESDETFTVNIVGNIVFFKLNNASLVVTVMWV